MVTVVKSLQLRNLGDISCSQLRMLGCDGILSELRLSDDLVRLN